MKRISAFTLVSLLLLCHYVQGQTPVIVNGKDRFLIGEKLAYFIDPSRSLSVNDVVQKPFQKSETDILTLGNIPHNVWMRFSIASKTERNIYLEVGAPLLDTIQLYKIENGIPALVFSGGMGKPFSTKAIHSENWLFDLDLQDSAPSTYYIKIHSLFPLQVPVTLASINAYTEYNQKNHLFWGLYIGVILFAFLYNFFIYVSVRERKYLYYVLYLIFSTLFYMGLVGFDFQFLWPDHPQLNYYLQIAICICNVLVTLFAMNFLNITRKQKLEYYGGLCLIGVFSASIMINLANGIVLSVILGQVLSLIACLFYITVAIRCYRRGVPSAKFYLTAWTTFLVFVFIFILGVNDVLPANFFTTHCIFIGHMTEAGLLSFALASRINWLKSENEKNQREIIHQLRLNEDIQLEANRVLEQKVVERTAEVVKQRNEAVKQRQRSDELLLNILPKETADEIKNTGTARARLFDNVTVMFADIKNFTKISESLSPEEIVSEINDYFSAFDRILEAYRVEKIKTIGDAYMAVGGLPTQNDTHARDTVLTALEIVKYMQERQAKRSTEGKLYFELRIGIHSGPVVAGVVGLKKFAYDIWGDTVNIASRMEACSEVGRVNISASTYELIKDEFRCTYRGKIEAKNKGMIDMYFVDGVKQLSIESASSLTEVNEPI